MNGQSTQLTARGKRSLAGGNKLINAQGGVVCKSKAPTPLMMFLGAEGGLHISIYIENDAWSQLLLIKEYSNHRHFFIYAIKVLTDVGPTFLQNEGCPNLRPAW